MSGEIEREIERVLLPEVVVERFLTSLPTLNGCCPPRTSWTTKTLLETQMTAHYHLRKFARCPLSREEGKMFIDKSPIHDRDFLLRGVV
jgi:hypothetical protein